MANPLPHWLHFRANYSAESKYLNNILKDLQLNTVCQGALCPNKPICWARKTATFLLLGDTCTRHCHFCSVKKGKPLPPDPLEPDKIEKAVERLNLHYVVLTMVTRDDLPDGGASHVAKTVENLKEKHPNIKVEILVSDFLGNPESIKTILKSNPDVFAHNIETVNRLTKLVRDNKCSYERSIDVLKTAKEVNSSLQTKSGLMVGLGENHEEVLQAINDLYLVGCSIITIGQYLQPTKKQIPVQRFVHPSEFEQYKKWAAERYPITIIAGPNVRSSYLADIWCNNQEQGPNI